MPAANIKINGVASSNDNLPINTLVTLDNLGVGGETTYSWAIVTQPEGAADALSNAAVQSPTFTPKKEGSYLIRLTVNGAFIDEKIVAVRDIKTLERAPAALEKTQVDGTGLGWSQAMNRWLKRVSSLYGADFGVLVGVAGGNMNRGEAIAMNDVVTLKTGLPGAEIVPQFVRSGSNGAGGPVGICEGTIAGGVSPINGDIIRVRMFGLYSQLLAGSPLNGDPIYNNQEVLQLTPPDGISRVVGIVTGADGSHYRIFWTGMLAHLGIADSQALRPWRTFGTWGLLNIPANATSTMEHPVQGSGIVTKAANGAYIIRALQVDMTAVAAGSTVKFEVYKNGVATGKSVTLSIGSSTGYIEFDRSLTVDSGAAVEVRVTTTAGWTGTTIDATVDVIVEDVFFG